jgi:predicted O-methyltransferase YrrM
MTNSLQHPAVRAVLSRLFDAAARDHENEPDINRTTFAGATAQYRADVLEAVYMPISRAGGRLLYSLVRAARPATVVEFGTSFGISAIHLAAGIADNGTGRVLTTEMSSAKIAAAGANIAEAGLAGAVTILPGDALESLKAVTGPVDLLFLDGWKDLCLPVLRLLEPRLAAGALVIADDAVGHPGLADYLAYVRDDRHGYVTTLFPVEDGMEVSCWTGSASV